MWFILLYKNTPININQNKDIKPQAWKLYMDKRIYQLVLFPLDWRIENNISLGSVKEPSSRVGCSFKLCVNLYKNATVQIPSFYRGSNQHKLRFKGKAIFWSTQKFVSSRTRIEKSGCLVARWEYIPSWLVFSKWLTKTKLLIFTL